MRVIIHTLIHISWISKRDLVNSLTFTVHLATDKLLVTSYYSIASHRYRVSVSQDDRVLEICWTTQCWYLTRPLYP